MAELNQITVATKRFVHDERKALVDAIFNVSPTLAYVKENLKLMFDGGRFIQESFLYAPLIGGAYVKGSNFDITRKQVEQAGQFGIKYQQVNVTFAKEDIQVENAGDAQIFSLVTEQVELAYKQIGQYLAIGMFMQGQGAGGVYTPNLVANVNGLAEAINDGTNASWDGNTYTTYGTITRGGAVGTALNSTPQNIAGTLEYARLEEEFGNACFGGGEYEPNLLATTVLGFSYLKEKFQAQQTYESKTNLELGITGMSFNGAMVVKDRYVPGSAISGTTDPIVSAYLDSTVAVGTAYPTMTSETLWILNARNPFMNFYMSSDPEYQFGFTGFKPAQDNTIIAGQILWAGNITVPVPRYHRQLFGITG
jgi:hypothetical protein